MKQLILISLVTPGILLTTVRVYKLIYQTAELSHVSRVKAPDKPLN